MGNYLILLRNTIEKLENVRLFLNIRHKKLNYLYSNDIMGHKLILGLRDLTKFSEIIKQVSDNSNIVLSKIKNRVINDIEVMEYILFANDNFVELIIVNEENVLNISEYFGNYEIISDKDDVLNQKVNIEVDYMRPLDRIEFIEECIEFYLDLMKIFVSYNDNNIIKCNILKNELCDKLVYIINIYISIKYDNKVLLDSHGANLVTYLDQEYYDELVSLTSKISDTWTFIFKSGQLFRRIAMSISEKEAFTYPKSQDVEIMKYLRNKYSEEKK